MHRATPPVPPRGPVPRRGLLPTGAAVGPAGVGSPRALGLGSPGDSPLGSAGGAPLSRRRVLAAALAAGGVLLGGCDPTDEPAATRPTSGDARPTVPPPAPSRPVTGQTTFGLPAPTGTLVTSWSTDPWALGSYSFLAREASPEDRTTLSTPPGGRLLLAGEATDPDFPSTVHGALRSGVRAAEQARDAGWRSVVVVGAGAAGLAAAAELAQDGVDVVVVEGRERLGGRVWTDTSLGVPVDLGASWIHGVDGNPLVALAEEAGAELHPFDYDDVDVVEVGDDVEAFEVTAEIEHEFGADVDELSPEAVEEGEELGGGDALLPGGYVALLEVLATRLADAGVEVRTSSPVTRISWGGTTATVAGPAGEATADGVVVTLPLGVLKARSVGFDPPLPDAVSGAVDRLGMGVLDKVVLAFDEPFWPEDVALLGIVPEVPGEFVEWVNLLPVVGRPVVMGFNAGSVARRFAALDPAAVVAAAMRTLADAYA